jgi:hypothetical protein
MMSRLNLKALLSLTMGMGAIALTTASPAFSQITPEPLQPTIEPLQPAGVTIEPIAPQLAPLTTPPTNPNSGTSITPMQPTGQFTFTNSLQYSNCLEDILQLYQAGAKFRLEGRRSNCRDEIFQAYRNRQIPKEQALELVQVADFYATSLLSNKLYPLGGQRQRIRQMFGLTYAIDTNNQTVLRPNL